MADCTALDRLLDQAPDHASAGALALKAGVDISFWDQAYVVLDEALDRGLIEMDDIDRACGRVLAAKERLGLLSPAGIVPAPGDTAPGSGSGHFADDAPVITGATGPADLLARRLARQSVVLLRNNGVLPLAQGSTLAVVGPNSDDLLSQLGDYTAPRPTPDAESSRCALPCRATVSLFSTPPEASCGSGFPAAWKLYARPWPLLRSPSSSWVAPAAACTSPSSPRTARWRVPTWA